MLDTKEERIYSTNIAHLEKVDGQTEASYDDVVAMVSYNRQWYKKSQTFYTIMASLEVGSALKRLEENEETYFLA